MSKNRKITSQEFDYLLQMEPYVAVGNEESKKQVKYALLNAIEGVFGDKWFNLKDKTRQAIDYICFLSIERGFVWASPDHIAEKSGIGKSTIYDALKLMREESLLYKANRCSRKQNGLGCPVHFFTNHPYFAHIKKLLNLDWNPERKADWKAENAETPCAESDFSDSNAPTYSLPTFYQKEIQNNDIQPNVSADDDSASRKKVIKYVPKEINNMYAHIFGEELRNIWIKVTQAFKTINHPMLTKEDLLHYGKIIIQRLFIKRKERLREGSDMLLDHMCAFVYKTARETFYNVLAEAYMETYEEDMERYYEEKEFQLEEAIKAIPTVEEWFVKVHPHYCYERIMREVVRQLKVMFPLLDKSDLEHLECSYTLYSRQFEMIEDYYAYMRYSS